MVWRDKGAETRDPGESERKNERASVIGVDHLYRHPRGFNFV